MKYFKLIIIVFTLCFFTKRVQSQTQKMWWGGMTVNEIVDKSDLIFEGRILTDSAFNQDPPGHVYCYHKVLVLKQFKGTFISDTITVIINDGKMLLNGEWDGNSIKYAHIGDEAVFLLAGSQHVKFPNNDLSAFYNLYGPGVGFVTVCDKKDVVKEVYEPLETVIGQKHISVHPNTCKARQEIKK